jgi:hypothetical protein
MTVSGDPEIAKQQGKLRLLEVLRRMEQQILQAFEAGLDLDISYRQLTHLFTSPAGRTYGDDQPFAHEYKVRVGIPPAAKP